MNINAILFNRGAAGNFLARVLTLDPATVALGSNEFESAAERCKHYCYPVTSEPPAAHHSNGLSVWVNNELNNFYFPFTRGIEKLVELDKIVIEPIHPDHYYNKLSLLGDDDCVQLYYMDIDDCEDWVMQQVRHKILKTNDQLIVEDQKQQNSALADILQQASAEPIFLKRILMSDESFLQEYLRISQLMGLNAYCEFASAIYQSWRCTWGTQ